MRSKVLANLLVATLLSAAILTRDVRMTSRVEVTSFGANPTGLRVYVYVPDPMTARPAILMALHYCTGSDPVFYSGTEFVSLADRYGFIVIYPSATRSGSCWGVSLLQALQQDGGSDPIWLISIVTYVEQHNNGDPNRFYITGASSSAMMTNVLLGDYSDVFKAGAAFMGMPFGCLATTDGSMWNSTCANGQIAKTPQQWGDLACAAFLGYTGPHPRRQIWYGTTDTILNYKNFSEEIKRRTNVLDTSQTPAFTARTRYGATGVGALVEAISIQCVGHSLPLSGQAAMAIQFFGLDNIGPTPTTVPPTGIPPTTGPSANLLTNGSIESGTSGWSVFCSGSLSTNTNVVHDGAQLLLITGRTATWNGPSQSMIFRLPNGRNYTTSVWVRTQSGTPSAKVTMQLMANGSISYMTLAPAAAVNSSGRMLLPGTANASRSRTLSSANFYVNALKLVNLTINGVDYTNHWAGSGSYPPPINGFWYTYSGNYPWSHFEA